MRLSAKLACAVAVVAAALSAQTAPTFPIVRLNITTDSQGSGELTAADLQIADQGKGQSVVYLRHVDASKAARTGPGEFTNRTASLPHTAVILIDYLNNGQQDNIEETHRLGKSLQSMASGENVYLYLLTMEGNIQAIHGLPGDPAAAPGEDKTWTKDMYAALEKLMKKEVKARNKGLTSEFVTKRTYFAIESLAKLLAPLPGRRDIVYVTNGFDSISDDKKTCNGDWIECGLYLQHLVFTLDRAGAVLDPISIGGLLSPDGNRDMEMVAGLTGGKPFYNQEPAAVLAQLAAMANDSYWVAFDLASDAWDSKFHRLKISAGGKGGKLQARNRFFAYPDTRPAVDRARAAVGPLLMNGADEPALGVFVKTTAVAGGMHLQGSVDGQDIMVRESGGVYLAHITLLVGRQSATGLNGEPYVQDFDLKLDKDKYALLLKDGLTFAQDVPLDPATVKLRVIAFDHSLGVGGAVTVPVAK